MRRYFETAYYRHTLLMEHVESSSLAAAEDTPHRALELQLRRQEMLDLLTYLIPAHRQVIILRFVEDFSLAEIAAILPAPLGTVKTRLVRDLVRLRDHLGQPAESMEGAHDAAV